MKSAYSNRAGNCNKLYRKMVHVHCMDTMEESCFPRGKTVFLLVLFIEYHIPANFCPDLKMLIKIILWVNTLSQNLMCQIEEQTACNVLDDILWHCLCFKYKYGIDTSKTNGWKVLYGLVKQKEHAINL